MNLPVLRTRDNAVVAGVCAGLARRWNVDPNLLRIAVVITSLASGLGLVAYGVAVAVLPTEGTTEPPVHRILPFTRSWPLPAVVAGWMLAFTLSLDDLVISSFTTGPGATTLPMKIYSQVRLGVTPEINAICTILIGIVTTGVIIASIVTKRREVERQRAERLAFQTG